MELRAGVTNPAGPCLPLRVPVAMSMRSLLQHLTKLHACTEPECSGKGAGWWQQTGALLLPAHSCQAGRSNPSQHALYCPAALLFV
jgi:hypothetical protein